MKTHLHTIVVPVYNSRETLKLLVDRVSRVMDDYTVRNRYLYVRKFLKIYSPVLYVFWIYKHLNHAFSCYRIGKKDVMRVILRGLVHGLIGRGGSINGTDAGISSGKR